MSRWSSHRSRHSGAAQPRDGTRWEVLRGVWGRLGVLSSAMAMVGCVFPEPPDYEQPTQTPPFLWSPTPATTEILRRSSGENVDINVNLRSQDNGNELWVFLYLDYSIQGTDASEVNRARMDPGTIEQERILSISWTVPPLGSICKQLSLVVSPKSNFDQSFRPRDYRYVGILTWWVDINDTEESISLGDCPHSAGGSQ
jgi:hypothetical protein